MGILPWDFWGLTPRELSQLARGQQAREKREFERLAHLACWLINTQPGRKRSQHYKVSDLLSPKPRKARRIDDVQKEPTQKT